MNSNENPEASSNRDHSLLEGWEGTRLNNQNSIRGFEGIIMRSCLESTLIRSQPEHSNDSAQRKKPSTDLHDLKRALLHSILERTCDFQVQKLLCGAANAAAEIAWDTNCPLLLFPCLFEEMAIQVLDRAFQVAEPDFQDPWAVEFEKKIAQILKFIPNIHCFIPV